MDARAQRDAMSAITTSCTAGILLIAGGSIYGFLGLAHAWYTWLDLASPRRIVPDDPAVILASLASLLKTRSDQWQMGTELVAKLQSDSKVGIDVGVAGQSK